MYQTQNNYTVYKHTNVYNGKVYIGLTCRKPETRWANGNGYYSNKHFFNAIKKYGWNDGFEHEIVASELNKNEAEELEIKLISEFDCTNPNKGYNTNLGGCSTGQHSEQTKKTISRNQYKVVFQYDRYSGDFIQKFDSTLQAQNELKIPNSNISSVCLKKCKTSHGFVFRYESDGYRYGEALSKEELEKINSNASVHKIGKYDIDGNLVAEFESITIATKKENIPKFTLYKMLKNNKQYNGYYYCYIENIYANEFKKMYNQKKNSKKKILQYSYDTGKLIKVFKSIHEASIETGINEKYIRYSCNEKHYSAGGYVWRFSGNIIIENKIDIPRDKRYKRPVAQLTLDGNIIKVYESISEAAKSLNVDASAISNCVRGKSKTSCGYRWCYNDQINS